MGKSVTVNVFLWCLTLVPYGIYTVLDHLHAIPMGLEAFIFIIPILGTFFTLIFVAFVTNVFFLFHGCWVKHKTGMPPKGYEYLPVMLIAGLTLSALVFFCGFVNGFSSY